MIEGYMEQTSSSQHAAGATKQTPMGRLVSAVDRLSEARGMVVKMSARLAGDYSDEATDQGKDAVAPSGVLGEIEHLASRIERLSDDIVSDISRVSKRM